MQPLGENMSNIPAFLGKLWKMVNDPITVHLISWSAAGNSFIIQNQAQFWYELLPLYYKHNNMSSFVRQLNMYGFHKMSTIENGTMDSDKDEIQFYHKYFQKGRPELLRNIKRKVTVAKSENNAQNVLKFDDLSKVLSDVKHLYGRQSSVDSQLSSMKQENAVLWRELAILRQKHLKQQQIVNKLIQFLVTLVQPSPSSRMGVSVKRRMPLMLHESPTKKSKKSKSTKSDSNEQRDNGPTIHELDSEIEISPEELFDQDVVEEGLVTSPHTSVSSPLDSQPDSLKPSSILSNEANNEDGLHESLFVEINPSDLMNESRAAENESNNLQSTNQKGEKVFLNPMGGNTLLSNIANGSYNANVINTKNGKKINSKSPESTINNLLELSPKNNRGVDLQVATRNNNGTNDCYKEDLDLHLETTQSEIEQLKDILKGCNGLDANALLGLFNDEAPSFGLPYNHSDTNKDNPLDTGSADPMVSGTELTTYGNNLIDFNELFDDSLDGQDGVVAGEVHRQDNDNSINTPMVIKGQPLFPNVNEDL